MSLPDADELLERAGFEAETSVLTRRQAEVLALREEGHAQADIADVLGTSRANVSSVESSARENVAKARETVAFAEALSAPVQLTVEAGTDLYDVPEMVYSACDDAGDAVHGREVRRDITVTVTGDGSVQVRE